MGLYRCPRTEAARVVFARVADEFNTPPQAPLTLRGGRVLEEAEGEAHVSTEQPEASQAARLSAADADPRRAGHRPGTAPEGPRPAVGLIGRIGDRATFDALRRDGCRARRDPVTVLFLPEPAGANCDVRVAYSIGRRVGTAVDRNRVRRRLRAAMRDVSRDGDGLSSGAYLVLVRPEAGITPYRELRRSLGEACAAAARSADS
jgi:ribonuclease P protein component